MYQRARERIVLWPVAIEVPVDGGKTETSRFQIQMRLLTVSEAIALAESPPTEKEAREIVMDHIVGWTDVVDESQQPLAFTRDALAELMNEPYFAQAVSAALTEVSREAPGKTSSRGRSGI